MRTIGKIEWEKFIVPAGIVVGGYFLFKHFGLLSENAANANDTSTNAATTAGNAQAIAAETAKGGFATLSTSEAAGIANAIYVAGTSDPVDEYTIQNEIIQANTTLDVLNIASAFGTKQASSSGSFLSSLGIGFQAYNLSGFIRATVSSSVLNTINNYFADQGINYQI